MHHVVDAYPIRPGEHCGSAAMRGLLEHYTGLELPEPAVFGLGAGVASVYIRADVIDPPVVLFGRTLSLEVDLGRHLGIDYRERSEEDDDEAWEIVRSEVLAGRPTMLAGDIFYLDYRDYKVHFPGHRFVLLGFDDEREQAFIADRIRDEPETCSLEAVRKSRNPPEGSMMKNLWGRFHDTQVGNDLRTACVDALRHNATEMLGLGEAVTAGIAASGGATTGLAGARAFAADLPGFATRADAGWIASFNASCLEKFGNGGGNFRRLYAGFLEWARGIDASLAPPDAPLQARAAADAWTAASAALFRASETPTNPAPWSEAARCVDLAAEIEETLFRALADRHA